MPPLTYFFLGWILALGWGVRRVHNDSYMFSNLQRSCLLLCLASYFSFFVLLFFLFLFFPLHPGMFYLLRVPSSVQQPSATLSKYVFYSTCSFFLCHLYPTPSRNSFVFFYSSSIFFRSSYFSGGFFVVVLSYPVR